MATEKKFEKLSDLFKKSFKKTNSHFKAPIYIWQDLALRVINELNIPIFKKSAIFKVCKENSQTVILRCLNDTKELCKTNQKWNYFFKLINKNKNP